MADRVLYSGVGCIADLIVKEGLINLDFADARSVMRDMGRAMMGREEAKEAAAQRPRPTRQSQIRSLKILHERCS
jgi:cell division GTPase FtsZ